MISDKKISWLIPLSNHPNTLDNTVLLSVGNRQTKGDNLPSNALWYRRLWHIVRCCKSYESTEGEKLRISKCLSLFKRGVFAICLLLRRYQVRTPIEQFTKASLIKVFTRSEEIGWRTWPSSLRICGNHIVLDWLSFVMILPWGNNNNYYYNNDNDNDSDSL